MQIQFSHAAEIASRYTKDRATVAAMARAMVAAPAMLEALRALALCDTVGGVSAGERKGLTRAAEVARATLKAAGLE